MIVGMIVHASSMRCEPRIRGVEPVVAPRRYFTQQNSMKAYTSNPEIVVTIVTYQKRYSNLCARVEACSGMSGRRPFTRFLPTAGRRAVGAKRLVRPPVNRDARLRVWALRRATGARA